MTTSSGNDSSGVDGGSKISDERLEEILQTLALSEDMRAGIGKPREIIQEAIFAKLDYAFLFDLSYFLENLEEEGKGELYDLFGDELSKSEVEDVKKGAPTKRALLQKAVDAIGTDAIKAARLAVIGDALRSLQACRKLLDENGQHPDIDELSEKLVGLIGAFNKLRVSHDVIPLLLRGLYAGQVQKALDFWKTNKDDPVESKKESAWQGHLEESLEVLQRALGGSVVLVEPQAHVGSPNLDGKGDRITDFLLQHGDTKNIFLVEIKTPETPLLGKAYRNTYGLSEELSGSIGQVLLQRHDAMLSFHAKHYGSPVEFNVAAPRCVVIAGRIDKQIGDDKQKKRAFEMQRQAVEANARIITFDELYHDFSTFHVMSEF